jgi:predicted dehydrogenase
VLVGTSDDGQITAVIERSPCLTRRGWRETARVDFERGFVQVELPPPLAINRAGRISIYRDGNNETPPQTVSPEFPPLSAMANQAANFVRAVRGEAPPPCDAREALEDLKLAMDFFRLRNRSG